MSHRLNAILSTVALAALAGCAAPPGRPVSDAALGDMLTHMTRTETVPMASGYLCCNMRSDGSWISDSNYMDAGKHVIPLGTPIRVTGYGRFRVDVQVEGRAQELGDDFSRDLGLATFAARYVVPVDPRIRLATFPPEVRQAIEKSQVRIGMTREQVLMALGPVTSSGTPDVRGSVWRYFVNMRDKFHVVFDGDVVKDIEADAMVRNIVVAR